MAGIGFVAKFTAGGGADVVPHDAAEGDDVDVTGSGGAEAEVDVFAAVNECGVEAAQFLPKGTANEDARAGDRHGASVKEGERREARGERQGAEVFGFALGVDGDAGVIEGAGGGVELEVADETGAWAVGAVGGEHRLKPVGREDEIVVEQGEKLAAGERGSGVIGGGVAEIFRLQDDADGGVGGEGGEPGAGAVGAAVVDENDLVGEAGGKRRAERGEHRLREGEAVVEWNEERDRHARRRLRREGRGVKPLLQRLGQEFL